MLEPATGNSPDDQSGGTVLFTGATASTRGASAFATFAAGKHGLRALSQSLAREFGKQNIHVAHIIIDGTILTKKTRQMFGGRKHIAPTPGQTQETTGDDSWMDDDTRRLDPVSVAKVGALSSAHFVLTISYAGVRLVASTRSQCVDPGTRHAASKGKCVHESGNA
jgi:NAD(P)-dependent dehydrogenase (short-subunit alcohol dehydrogenase family)